MNLYYRHSWIFIVDYHAQDPEKDNKCDAEYGVDCPRKSLPEPEKNVKNSAPEMESCWYYWYTILYYYYYCNTLIYYTMGRIYWYTILYYSYTILFYTIHILYNTTESSFRSSSLPSRRNCSSLSVASFHPKRSCNGRKYSDKNI